MGAGSAAAAVAGAGSAAAGSATRARPRRSSVRALALSPTLLSAEKLEVLVRFVGEDSLTSVVVCRGVDVPARLRGGRGDEAHQREGALLQRANLPPKQDPDRQGRRDLRPHQRIGERLFAPASR